MHADQFVQDGVPTLEILVQLVQMVGLDDLPELVLHLPHVQRIVLRDVQVEVLEFFGVVWVIHHPLLEKHRHRGVLNYLHVLVFGLLLRQRHAV